MAIDKVLSIFDMDDTLFETGCKTKVIKNGEIVKELSTSELAGYKLHDSERFDFSEFRCSRTFYNNARPIESFFQFAIDIINNQGRDSRCIIITARTDCDDKEVFIKTFRKHGFPIDKCYVERAGNWGVYKGGFKTQVYKGAVIKKYINNFDIIRMWDDSTPNLDMLIKLGRRHGIRTEAYLVDPTTGNFTRYDNGTSSNNAETGKVHT